MSILSKLEFEKVSSEKKQLKPSCGRSGSREKYILSSVKISDMNPGGLLTLKCCNSFELRLDVSKYLISIPIQSLSRLFRGRWRLKGPNGCYRYCQSPGFLPLAMYISISSRKLLSRR